MLSGKTEKLTLPTLAYRRIRSQMIEVYKIINNIHDSKESDKLLAFRKTVTFNLRGNYYTFMGARRGGGGQEGALAPPPRNSKTWRPPPKNNVTRKI